MLTHARRITALLLAGALILGTVPGARAAQPAPDAQDGAIGRTPPRLSYVNGEVSFWRPGAQDWAPAQLNTPLAPGDELYTGNSGNVELQVGGRAFVRGWGDTQLGLVNQEPDFLQIKVTTGHVAIDVRAIDAGHTVELDTPNAVFTIESPGYYRADVADERTLFITRRAGRATVTTASGQPAAVSASEEVVIEGTASPTVQSYVAPELDVWDHWNYARTDELLDAVSARYIPAGVYGVDDLDHYGAWRVVPTYGAVWVPEGVAAGWVPYSTGSWVWDSLYGWSWVDLAPWGWAPYHYGRWVYVDGFWAWAPGPIVRRAIYAPALVAFFGAPGIRVTVGVPFVTWVALGWGEPLVPWWGRPSFRGHAWWAGWGGPRIVNNVVVSRTTVVEVKNIKVYRNVGVQHAVVAVREDRFGRGAVHEARVTEVDVRRMAPVHGQLKVAPNASSYVAASGRAPRPPEAALSRRTVATRPPAGRHAAPPGEAKAGAPAPRIVPKPRATTTAPAPQRPPFGRSNVERQRPSPPLRYEPPRRNEVGPARPREGSSAPTAPQAPRARTPQVPATAPRGQVPPGPAQRAPEPGAPPAQRGAPSRQPERAGPSAEPPRAVERPGPTGPRVEPPRGRERQVPAGPRIEPPRSTPRQLPGEPANRLFQGRGDGGGQRQGPRSDSQPHGGGGKSDAGPSRDRRER